MRAYFFIAGRKNMEKQIEIVLNAFGLDTEQKVQHCINNRASIPLGRDAKGNFRRFYYPRVVWSALFIQNRIKVIKEIINTGHFQHENVYIESFRGNVAKCSFFHEICREYKKFKLLFAEWKELNKYQEEDLVI